MIVVINIFDSIVVLSLTREDKTLQIDTFMGKVNVFWAAPEKEVNVH